MVWREIVVRVSIIGASGYVGGELARLLLFHPEVELAQVTSERLAGKPLTTTHPNLRGRTTLQFVPMNKVEPCDVLFLALPHGEAARKIDQFAALAPKIVDCSADFRLRNTAAYARWCAGLLDSARDVVIEVKVGSSEGGAAPSDSSHHPERSGVVRSFAPTGHRHTAEIVQATGLERVHLSITSVELVRGALATAHVFPREPLTEKDLWRAFRAAYSAEPFVRIVRERQGSYRLPEPKILAGSNYADVGFALDESSGRVVSICAIDNLMKGAAGTAVQCMNLMCGFDERAGLGFPGLHPV